MNKSILLVEDIDDDIQLTLRALKKCNASVETVVATDGQEALDYLFGQGAFAGRDTAIQPALVLLDLNLPKISGLEVLRFIRNDQRTRSLPVVVLTSSSSAGDRAAASALEADRYLQKPLGYPAFLEMVRRIVLDWLALE
ncbi:MAG: response regulator [Thermodesulfobacteriota bacterium]